MIIKYDQNSEYYQNKKIYQNKEPFPNKNPCQRNQFIHLIKKEIYPIKKKEQILIDQFSMMRKDKTTNRLNKVRCFTNLTMNSREIILAKH